MDDVYKTKDLSESAALLISKQHLVEIKREGKVCWFLFEDSTKCMAISNDFFFGKFMVNAREYYQMITNLKNRIFAEA